ncbi:hypothetical protein ACIRPK_26715 [Kitasatospora sp. NPDC101801]|uniref:hypothetical protein n=1 Tax=Kitasatospora sp. NPDC101801 TaxID=3364103 RepID=UPI003829D24E
MTTTSEPPGPAETTATPPVTWYATWECHDCRDGGDSVFDDGTIVDADHDCDEGDGEIAWEGRAECGCGWSLTTDFEDGDYVEANHDCASDG